MSTFVKLLSDLDGKILNIYSASQDNILFEKNSNKRIFNLIDKSSIIPFINDFNKFLISQNIYVKLTYSVYFNNSKTLSYIYIKKLNRHLLIKIKKINLTNSLIKKNKFLETLMFVVRFKFVIGSIMPFIFATFWSYCKYKEIVFLFLILMFMAIILLHMAANTFNDYFDWSSGRDVKNVDYLLASTGGSRAIDFNLIKLKI